MLKLKFEELFFHVISAQNDYKFLYYLSHMNFLEKENLAQFMNDNFTLPLNVSEFAKQCSRSLSTFKREFQQVFNESPKKWITNKRLNYAYDLLNSTDKNVTEICYDSGFENLSYFIQIFKKKFGITPKQLKARQF